MVSLAVAPDDKEMRDRFLVHVLAVEYPGYGIYQDYDSALFAGSKT